MSVFDWINRLLGTGGGHEFDGPSTPVKQLPRKDDGSKRVYSIENAWRDHLAPVIRECGFKGSGRNFRLLKDGFALAVNLQGLRYGGKFTVNLGVQPLAIPNVIGGEVDPRGFKEIECAFRERLSADALDTWWSYTDDIASLRNAATGAATLFRKCAMSQLENRMAFALSVTPEDIGRGSPGTLTSLALFREAQGDLFQAKAFAQMARETATPHWVAPTSLRHLLDGQSS